MFFLSALNDSAELVVSPGQPAYFQYQFPPHVWSVVVHALDQSTNHLCAVFSVQAAKVIKCLFLNSRLLSIGCKGIRVFIP